MAGMHNSVTAALSDGYPAEWLTAAERNPAPLYAYDGSGM
jgi:hypothetical protein